MNCQLVPMDRSHLAQVAAIERACFSHPWPAALLEQELENSLLSLMVAEGEDGTVLGYSEVRTVLDEGTLEKIAVAPAFRRRGVAEKLLRFSLRWGETRLAFLTLEVRESNFPAIGLYEKLGFQVVGRRKNYYREEHEDALLMTLTFSQEAKETE
ncbi:ribosomal protein S18-alanine N-acetyltransferase [uncultured Flavonifractor sp.]|uniref:ribosomal protein S18-alanine N-acetyltransferase n=1 Tax=uncultured Flavonifractor sp. TaxID=1193534 RepID=UPI00261D8C39|nr:ribosomal protein S18-alanine N-acetyltransferase [uncultured Flavonifractor sp.]